MAEDLREAQGSPGPFGPATPPWSSGAPSPDINGTINLSMSPTNGPSTPGASSVTSSSAIPNYASLLGSSPEAARRTPTPPAYRPGYARHEVEGIGGVVKSMRVRTVRIGRCVPEWEDEKHRGAILDREVSGTARSWCGWCWRPVPSKREYQEEKPKQQSLPLREAGRS